MKFSGQLYPTACRRSPLDVGGKNQVGKQQEEKEYSHLQVKDIGAGLLDDKPIVSGGAAGVIYCYCISAWLIGPVSIKMSSQICPSGSWNPCPYINPWSCGSL